MKNNENNLKWKQKGDESKILAAYADGTVRAWDVLTKHNRYDLKGRSPYISCLQYDATR